MSVYLIIKSETSLVDNKQFDDWYSHEHLKEAKEDFGAISAKRGWITNRDLHVAIYEFQNIYELFVLSLSLHTWKKFHLP